jgi:Fic family protein
MYIWALPGWPHFEWDDGRLIAPLGEARLKQGRLLGRMASLGLDLKREAQLQATTEDVVKSSEIEGERLDREDVRSSLARRLGVPDAGLRAPDRRTEGVVDMMLDATTRYDEPLTPERLFGWHAALFPTGYSDSKKIRIGDWRDDTEGPMQVVSGPLERPRVHYQAPPADRLSSEIAVFLRWFNGSDATDGLIRAGIAHLWFVTIHPFDDGNGRISRAIADQAIARSEVSRQRFYSLSSQIQKERTAYYDTLERTQSGTLDITDWLVWFLGCFSRAIDGAEATSAKVMGKAGFWQSYAREAFTERQKHVLNRFLDGLDGKLTAKRWAALGKCSVPTAQRDISDLVDRGILVRNPGGSKNTSYQLTDGAQPQALT